MDGAVSISVLRFFAKVVSATRLDTNERLSVTRSWFTHLQKLKGLLVP